MVEIEKIKKIDFEALRLSSNFPMVVSTAQPLTQIPIRKPRATEFFRVREGAEWVYDTPLLELKEEENEKYLVLPEFRSILAERNLLKPVRIFLLLTWSPSVVFLSEIPLPDAEGKLNTYHKSRHEHYERALHKWVSITPDKSQGAYRVVEALGNLPEPRWPSKPESIIEAVELAFKDRVIDNINHPVLKKLRGEV